MAVAPPHRVLGLRGPPVGGEAETGHQPLQLQKSVYLVPCLFWEMLGIRTYHRAGSSCQSVRIWRSGRFSKGTELTRAQVTHCVPRDVIRRRESHSLPPEEGAGAWRVTGREVTCGRCSQQQEVTGSRGLPRLCCRRHSCRGTVTSPRLPAGSPLLPCRTLVTCVGTCVASSRLWEPSV